LPVPLCADVDHIHKKNHPSYQNYVDNIHPETNTISFGNKPLLCLLTFSQIVTRFSFFSIKLLISATTEKCGHNQPQYIQPYFQIRKAVIAIKAILGNSTRVKTLTAAFILSPPPYKMKSRLIVHA
jgi:hypothetical protein